MFIASYQLACFYPFFRAHNYNNFQSQYREPWLQNLDVQEAIREAIFLRYSLFHYLYSLFYEYSTTGVPLIRPIFVEFPFDKNMENVAHEFMFGSQILVVPKMTRYNSGECRKNECPNIKSHESWEGVQEFAMYYDVVEVFLPGEV